MSIKMTNPQFTDVQSSGNLNCNLLGSLKFDRYRFRTGGKS